LLSLDGLVDERYDNSVLKETLEHHLGHARLRDVISDIFVTAYEIKVRKAFFFRSARASGREGVEGAPEAYDYALADVALATSSAPTYFEPVEVTSAAGEAHALIDGGVYATNPAMCGYAELRKRDSTEDLVLVSLGTGTQTREHAIDIRRARGWGTVRWARPVIDIMFDGVADTVEFELDKLLGSRYLRFQTVLEGANEAMDDASPENLRNLRRLADRLVTSKEADIDEACRRLAA
jgi:predicted acylesterase/phospholipase RssA